MITVNFFAGLKRFFTEPIKLDNLNGQTALDLIDELKNLQPEAIDLLSKCRIAVHEEFVELNTKLENGMEIFLIPPSSGG